MTVKMINSMIESYGDESVRQHFLNLGYDLDLLKRDEFFLKVINVSDKMLRLFYTYVECIRCPYRYHSDLPASANVTLTISSKWRQQYRIVDQADDLLDTNETSLCDFNEGVGEFGIYELNAANCVFATLKEPVNIYLPILTVILIILGLVLVMPISKYFWRTCMSEVANDVLKKQLQKKMSVKERLKSLDTFRGISIILMIFVNYGHGGYSFLEHAPWNGLYVGDLVFPWFLWIMGVCIPISLTSQRKKGVPRIDILKNIFRRSCILFGLGLFLNAGPYLDQLRVFGVLQRFGITYLVVGFICLTMPFQEDDKNPTLDNKLAGFVNKFEDILRIKTQWLAVLIIVAIHCLVTLLLHAPNCPQGYLGPGGLHDGARYRDCTGGAAGYIDHKILGVHVYQWPTIKTIYDSPGFDPEGILGLLTSILQVFLGVQAGMTILCYKQHVARIIRWLMWASFTGILGGILCNFSKEDGVLPVNKNLWSLSFVLVTSSFAFALLTFCYYVMDIKRWWQGTPFIFAGMNATIMYVGHSITYSNFIIHWYLSQDKQNRTHFISLIENCWATGIWLLISYWLYRVGFFLTI